MRWRGSRPHHAMHASLTQSPASRAPAKQYHKMFRMEGVELEVRELALRAIARKALARKTGARGLRSILEQVLLDVMYDLPSLTNLSRVIVDESTINNDGKPLLMFAEKPKVAAAHS